MSNPIFIRLMTKYAEIYGTGLEVTPEISRFFCEAMTYAPEHIQNNAIDMVVEALLMQEKPFGHTEAGRPIYSLGAMAECLDIEPDDMPEHIKAQAYRCAIHRIH
jgi:hypothetical protein